MNSPMNSGTLIHKNSIHKCINYRDLSCDFSRRLGQKKLNCFSQFLNEMRQLFTDYWPSGDSHNHFQGQINLSDLCITVTSHLAGWFIASLNLQFINPFLNFELWLLCQYSKSGCHNVDLLKRAGGSGPRWKILLPVLKAKKI